VKRNSARQRASILCSLYEVRREKWEGKVTGERIKSSQFGKRINAKKKKGGKTRNQPSLAKASAVGGKGRKNADTARLEHGTQTHV